MNQIVETIKKRHSVRKYLDKPVPKEILKEMIDAGRLAPTARNEQPWEFVVVTKSELLEKVAEATDHGKFIKGAGACIIVCCKDTKYFLEDGSAATENIILTAESFGVASCWVAGHKKGYCGDIKKILGIPDDLIVISLISLGYAGADDILRKPKKSVDEVIHWEKF
ncbi:MAG: nitroreductase family protein [bacterium]